jgi:hypothetical protein
VQFVGDELVNVCVETSVSVYLFRSAAAVKEYTFLHPPLRAIMADMLVDSNMKLWYECERTILARRSVT